MLILGIDGAKGGCGWTLLRLVRTRITPLDLGRFTPSGTYKGPQGDQLSSFELRLLVALQQLAAVVQSYREDDEEVLVVIEEPPPTASSDAHAGRKKKQAQIGLGIGAVIGGTCIWALALRSVGFVYPWRVPVGEWRRAMGVGGRGMGGTWKANAIRVLMGRWPHVWPVASTYSSKFSGDLRADQLLLVKTSVVEKLESDGAAEVCESFLIAEYAATHQHLVPPGPSRKVRIDIGGGHHLESLSA